MLGLLKFAVEIPGDPILVVTPKYDSAATTHTATIGESARMCTPSVSVSWKLENVSKLNS